MTEFNFEKFIEQMRSTKMTETEKANVFSYLKSYSSSNPVRDLVLVSHRSWSNQLNQIFLKPMPILIVIAILISGGTSLSAEKTLPGDILYPIKLAVNENIRGLLAVSEDAKTELEISLVELRLEEAEKLAVESRMNEDIRVKLEENLQKHASKIESRIKKFESDDSHKAFEVASNFKTSLNAHAAILNDIGISLNNEGEPHLLKLTTKIRTEAKNMEQNESKSETDVKTNQGPNIKASAEGKFRAALNKIGEVEKYINQLNDRIDVETKEKVKTQLNLSKDILAQGEAKLKVEAYGEAFVLFQKAHNIAQRAKLLIRAKAEFDDSDPKPTTSLNPTPLTSPKPSPSPTPSTNASSTMESESKINIDDEIKVRGKIRINVDL